MSNKLETKKYHFLYKTTNLINNKFYIGMHSTSNLNDGYLGSGTFLRRSIKKYGKENFKCEILQFCINRKELEQKEEEIVNEFLLKNENCLNLTLGGKGWCTKTARKANLLGQKKKKHLKLHDKKWLKKYSKNRSKALENQYELGIRIKKSFYNWEGKNHTEETKEKISKKAKKNSKGRKNSQYGTMWITNEKESKKINKNSPIPNNWRKGRKIKMHS